MNSQPSFEGRTISNEEKRVLEKSKRLLYWLTQQNFDKTKHEIVQTIRASPSAFVIKSLLCYIFVMAMVENSYVLFARLCVELFHSLPPFRSDGEITTFEKLYILELAKLSPLVCVEESDCRRFIKTVRVLAEISNNRMLTEFTRHSIIQGAEYENRYNGEVRLRKETEEALASKMEELELMKWLLAKAWEQKHGVELRLRKETQYALAIERERIYKLKLQLQTVTNEVDNMRLLAIERQRIDKVKLQLQTVTNEVDNMRFKAEESESKYKDELRLRKETQCALAIERERIDKVKLQLQTVTKEVDNMHFKAEESESKYKDELAIERERIDKVKLQLQTVTNEVDNMRFKAEESKSKYKDELRLRKETQYALAIEREGIDKVKLQLQTVTNEVDKMRFKAEKYERKYKDERSLRKETETALSKEREELEEMTQLLEDSKTEQENLTSQVITWRDKYEEESSLRKEKEDALSREKQELDIVKGLLEYYNREADAMREERDDARKLVQELTRKQNEERQRQPLYLCPITMEVMKDPHFAADGFTYEAEAIRTWLGLGHDTSPMTNLKLPHRNLVPNHALRSAIQE